MITHTEQVGDRTQIKTWLLTILVIESAAVLGLRFLAGSSPWNSLLIVALLITFLVAIRLVASRFRFSLKFMLIAVNIIAVALVGPAFHVRRAGIEQTAVNAVTRGAGSVAFEPDFRRAPPDWIQRLVGPEYFNHAAFVQFGSAASDADLNHLSQLSRLTRLEFWQSNVTNAGLSRLKAVRNLRQLDFGGNPNIDATCFQHLLQIPKLESLHFDFPLTDQGLAYWPELALKLNGRESEVLNLTGLRISDAGLEHVSRMRSLTRLVLDGNARITDNGMQHLGKLRQLKVLVLARNQITDAGLAQLRGLDELEVLDLTVLSTTSPTSLL